MVLVFIFTEKCQFIAKNDGNSIFLGCEAHILYLIILYINFYGFKKIKF
jgi:hypothetical protein